jgi:hypothetical protein
MTLASPVGVLALFRQALFCKWENGFPRIA